MEWYLNYNFWLIVAIVLTVLTWVLIIVVAYNNRPIIKVLLVISMILMIIANGFLIASTPGLIDWGEPPKPVTLPIERKILLSMVSSDDHVHIYQQHTEGLVHIVKDRSVDMVISRKIIIKEKFIESVFCDYVNNLIFVKCACSKIFVFDIEDNPLEIKPIQNSPEVKEPEVTAKPEIIDDGVPKGAALASAASFTSVTSPVPQSDSSSTVPLSYSSQPISPEIVGQSSDLLIPDIVTQAPIEV